MRTTVTLAEDVAAAVTRLRRERGVGVSEAINQLARAGLTVRRAQPPFHQRSASLNLRVDATNVAEAVEVLDGASHR
jgi:Ribbon-helix-helix protein, copG family